MVVHNVGGKERRNKGRRKEGKDQGRKENETRKERWKEGKKKRAGQGKIRQDRAKQNKEKMKEGRNL